MIQSPINTEISCRIICIGNMLIEEDSAGPKVYKVLEEMNRPASVELVDGGLAGLNLLSYLENVERVIFVDQIRNFRSSPGLEIIPLPCSDIEPESYGHEAGLGYLMAIGPLVIESRWPDCVLVGIEGESGPDVCQEAALTCLHLASVSDWALKISATGS